MRHPGSPADRRHASGAACDRLRALIVTGRIAPGAPLVESDLSARLAVSRTPVRAALLRLQQEGLVVWAPAGGSRRHQAAAPRRAVVAPLTAGDLREIFLIVGALEAIAARQAAGLDADRRNTLVAVLKEADRGLCAAVARRPPDLAGALGHHGRFHRASVEAAGGSRLRAELDALAPQAERYQRVYGAAAMFAVDEFVRSHEAIAEAIGAGDGAAAEQAVGADWRTMAAHHAEVLEMLGERGSW